MDIFGLTDLISSAFSKTNKDKKSKKQKIQPNHSEEPSLLDISFQSINFSSDLEKWTFIAKQRGIDHLLDEKEWNQFHINKKNIVN